MLKNPNIGDRVKWINQPWRGTILEIQGQRARVLLNDGFEEWEQISKLTSENEIIDLDKIHDSKNEITHIESRPLKISEIDLHIENLFVHWKKIPKEKILEMQIQAFQEEFHASYRNSDELIVIHGKGSGILKENILRILQGQKQISYEAMQDGKYKHAAIKICFHKT